MKRVERRPVPSVSPADTADVRRRFDEIAGTDQRAADSREDASVLSAFYVTLVDAGVDPDAAATMTESYMSWWLSSGWGDE